MISRRQALKGIGTAIALPLLEGMLPLRALAAAPKAPLRMGFIFVPNGINMKQWTPSGVGTDLVLSPTLQPLANVQSSLNVLTGLTQHNAEAILDGPGDHARSAAAWLTGVHPFKTAGAGIHAGISADQVAAQRIGHETRFPSLELGCEGGSLAGDCDSGYSCAYSGNISWRTDTTPSGKEANPRLVFERLFGNGDTGESIESRAKRNRYRLSVLDLVLDDASQLKNKLGRNDQAKLDEYLTGVREIEQRMQAMEREQHFNLLPPGFHPAANPASFEEHIRLMGDMMILAFQADLTRVTTFMIANEGSNRGYAEVGVPEGHHEISHHGGLPEKLEKKKKIDTFHVAQLAYILEKMQSIKELDGTLLDNSMIVYGGGISDGNAHNHNNLPVLLAGRAGGALRGGRHITYPDQTPMNNLYLSMLGRMGIPVETLGNSTGRLATIF